MLYARLSFKPVNVVREPNGYSFFCFHEEKSSGLWSRSIIKITTSRDVTIETWNNWQRDHYNVVHLRDQSPLASFNVPTWLTAIIAPCMRVHICIYVYICIYNYISIRNSGLQTMPRALWQTGNKPRRWILSTNLLESLLPPSLYILFFSYHFDNSNKNTRDEARADALFFHREK